MNKKRKLLPPLIMLTAGAIASILLAVGGYELKSWLMILLIVLIVFYILGCIMKYILDTIEKQNEQTALEEGEVIEKTPESEEENQSQSQPQA